MSDATLRDATGPRRLFDTPLLTDDQPLTWMKRGWEDLRATLGISLTYGVLFTVGSILLVYGLYWLELQWVILPAAAGFTIIGPLMAMGLYEVSRRRALGDSITLFNALIVRTRDPVQVGYMAVLLMIGFMIWIRVAMINFALFFGLVELPGIVESIELLFTARGIGMVVVGSFLGAIFAVIAFAITAFSLPVFLTEQTDVITAMVRSAAVVRYNPRVALRWAALVVAATGFGFMTGFIGFIVVFPLLGHATWHAYQDTVAKQTARGQDAGEGAGA